MTDSLALGVIPALAGRDLRCPADVKVTSYPAARLS